ncbi:uncharacterized protein ZSWIM9 [Pelobates fuscus]|uniref:uncharacterized protein ZSWIM9 n=1 Tax=Pelobates fuscus TaxID=191477 RepID=UPI002FE49BEA
MALQPEKKKGRSLSLAGIAQISNDISRKFLDRSDLSRLLRITSSSLKDHIQVLAELDNFLIADPLAKIKLVFVEDTVFVKNIFVISSNMQDISQKFPEHLYIDLLSNVCPGFDLYTVSCEDGNSDWKICATCISKANNSDVLRFLVVSVLQSIPKMKSQIKYITIHPAIRDSLDMGTLLPNATIRHCILLIVQVVEKKISHLQLATQAQIKSIFNILLNTRSLKVYNRHLNELKGLCPAEVFQYYLDTWHPSRKQWYAKDNKKAKTEKTIVAYVMSLHYTLGTEINSSFSLTDCLRVILNDTRELKSVPDVLPSVEPQHVPEVPSTVKEEMFDENPPNELEHMEFYSWEAFHSFLSAWCKERKVIFVIRHSELLTSEDVNEELIQSLKYSAVNLGCTSYTRKRCPATIHLRLGPEKDKLIITKADLNHIHDSEIDLPSRFTRKPVSYVEIPKTVSSDVNEDKFMDKNDLTKLLRLHSPLSESQFLDELESLFNSDPTVKVKMVFSEEKFIVKNIFVMTTAMQNLLQHFHEHIFVDFFRALNQEFDLYSVLCQDESFNWKVCAYCIARKDSSESLKFLMNSFLQSNPNLSKKVKYITLSPEILNQVDTEVLFPNATVRCCLPLVLDKMHHKISFLSQMEQSQIKNLLVNLSQSSSTDIYRQHLGNLKTACPDEVFQYYYDTWHPCWKLWCEKDNRTSDVENSIFAYVKTKHQYVKGQVGSLVSLHQCLQAILTEDQEFVEFAESNHVEMSDTSSWGLQTTTPVEFQEQELVPDEITPGAIQKDCENILREKLDGKEFQSWDDFCCFLETCSKDKFQLRVSSSFTEESKGEIFPISDMALSLKYSWAQLSCSWNGCSAFVELALSPQKDKLIITQSNLQHTHNDEETTLSPPAKKCKVSATVGVPVQVANNISRKFLEPSDLKRLLRFRSGAFEDRTQVLGELDSLFVSDPNAKVKLVFVEDKLLVSKIFIMTSSMIEQAQKSPDYLFIDVCLQFSPSFDLYTLYCEEKGAGWKVCAYCIAKKGIMDVFEFLSCSVVQVVPALINQVKHVTVHPEIAEPLKVETYLPHASTRYCMHLVLDVLYQKIAHLDTTVVAQIKNFLHILSQTCSHKVYNEYLNHLKVVCPPEIFHYYYDMWHPLRKMWAKKDNRIEEAEKNIFELVSVKHEALKTELGALPSLHQCLCAVLGEQHKVSAINALLQDSDIPVCWENRDSPAVSPSSNDQLQNYEQPMLEVEGNVHRVDFSAHLTNEIRVSASEYPPQGKVDGSNP